MMKNFKETKTYENLFNSFAGESMAHMRYHLYEEMAKKEGHEKAAKFFAQAKEEEKGHASLWFKLLNGGEVPNTLVNLKNQIQAEHEEWEDEEGSYEHMAKVAREEGYPEIAKHFEHVAGDEEGHEGELHKILDELK
jgi:rubrerythrin